MCYEAKFMKLTKPFTSLNNALNDAWEIPDFNNQLQNLNIVNTGMKNASPILQIRIAKSLMID